MTRKSNKISKMIKLKRNELDYFKTVGITILLIVVTLTIVYINGGLK